MTQDPQDPQDAPQEDSQPVSRDALLELNFVPTWARSEPKATTFVEERPRRDRGRGSGGRGQGPRLRQGSGGAGRGQGTRLRQGSGAAGRGQRTGDRGQRTGDRRPSFAKASEGRQGTRERGRPRRDHDRSRRPREQAPRRTFDGPRIDIAFLPDRQHLGKMVGRIRNSQRAFPAGQVADLFLSHPAACLVKLEVRTRNEEDRLWQCGACKKLFISREGLDAHAANAHLEEAFDRTEVEGEAPKGQFVCVARCGLSGELLGPPNYHGYSERVQEVWRSRFPNMSLDAYRDRVETSRDEEQIQAWKDQVRKREVFRKKDAQEEDGDLSWAEAQALFAKEQLPRLVKSTRRVIVPNQLARTFDDEDLTEQIRSAWIRETRSPRSLTQALRPALRHMGLHFFKVGSGEVFVTSIAPRAIDPGQSVEQLRDVLTYLRDHPGCSRKDLVDHLAPCADTGSTRMNAVLDPLRWLVERGHVIEFFDGTLAVPV